MKLNIPSAEELRKRLARVPPGDLPRLAAASGVPYTTLHKIHSGETENPRIATVRQLWPHLSAAANA